jgi:hypothetical protein
LNIADPPYLYWDEGEKDEWRVSRHVNDEMRLLRCARNDKAEGHCEEWNDEAIFVPSKPCDKSLACPRPAFGSSPYCDFLTRNGITPFAARLGFPCDRADFVTGE